MQGLHPEGKHLACRRRQPDQQTISETALVEMLIFTAITEMMAADMTCMMLLGAITKPLCGNSASADTKVAVIVNGHISHMVYVKVCVLLLFNSAF